MTYFINQRFATRRYTTGTPADECRMRGHKLERVSMNPRSTWWREYRCSVCGCKVTTSTSKSR